MSQRRILIDGLPPHRAPPLDLDDPALTLGISAFETLRTFGRRAPLLDRHLRRLSASAAALGIPFPTPPILRQETDLILSSWNLPAGNLRLTLTGGGRRILRLKPAPPISPHLRCASRPWQPIVGLESIKHGSRAGWVIDVRLANADDVIWIDHRGCALEASTGALFALRGQTLLTPPLDGRILPSITRDVLLDVARTIGVPVRQTHFSLTDLDGLYLASSLKILAPVVALDGRSLDSAAHPILPQLVDGFLQRVSTSQGSRAP